MAVKVGINGFGRIGRMALRSIIENKRKDLEVVAINNKANNEISSFLLKHDTVHGNLKSKVSYSEKTIDVEGKKIQVIHETDIEKIDWKKFNVDVVLECTGKFTKKEKSMQHIKAGAKKVIVSAPVPNSVNIVYGVNEKILKSTDQVISAASCTTNCLATVCKVLNDNFEIERGFMTTVHSYTPDQRLLDNSHKDLRRARSAPNAIVPTTTGATKYVAEVIPNLKGKIDGISIRVPTPTVSLVEFVFSSSKNLTVENLNNSFLKASKTDLKNILDTTEEPLVSSDFIHNYNSSIVDLSLTKVINDKMAKISAWYDNEWGFANRMCDLAVYLGKLK